CSGMTQQISITVEPTPLAEAQDIDGDTDPLTETICHNGQIQTTIDVLAIDGHNYLVESISTSGPVGGVASAPYTRADGETIDPGMLTNTSSTV
ncbi:MAG: hypothetical protein KDC43_20800, partial [Saprospiraceae bacterium]|nr:hypothetical protein [Saprospiraceae bacterium]